MIDGSAGTPDRIVVLPARHDEHLSYEEMERWVDGQADPTERELVETHIEQCTICREEVADLARSRDSLSPRGRSRRYFTAAAVALVVIAGAAFVLTRRPVVASSRQQPSPSIAAPPNRSFPPSLQARVDAVLRSERLRMPEVVAALNSAPMPQRAEGRSRVTFAVLQPVGTVVLDQQPTLRWSALDGAVSYTIVIGDAETGARVANASTRGTEWSPLEPLQRGKTYSWQVQARGGGEVVIVPQPPAPEALFHVASDGDIASVMTWHNEMRANPLSAGILLAQEGYLDDAERELQRARDSGDARAPDLLAQVRSWRATPTAARP